MFAYCGNCPVNRDDPAGKLWGGVIAIGIAYLLSEWYQAVMFIADSNYSNNSAVDANPDTTTHNKLINDQNGDTGKNFEYGGYSASYNACETIAVHNAKVLLGMESTLSQTMYDCQMLGAMPLEGVIGTNPYALANVLDYYAINYSSVQINEMNQPGIYIISYWTEGRFQGPLHTVTVVYDGTQYVTYNCYGNGELEYGLPTSGRNYICGYYLGGQP